MVRVGDTIRVPVSFEVSGSRRCGEGNPEGPREPESSGVLLTLLYFFGGGGGLQSVKSGHR